MEEYTENADLDKICGLLEESFVEKVNNIKITDYDDWVEMCEKLSRCFSLIPLNRTEKERSKCKKPVEQNWSRACITRQKFERSKFVAYNPGVACGKASKVIVLNVLSGSLFRDFLEKNSFELSGGTFTTESGDGTVQYYFEYPDDGYEYKTARIGRDLTDEFGNLNEKIIFEIVGCDGYVLAPGALDPIAWKYCKIISNAVPAKAPVWILKILQTKKSRIIIKSSNPGIKKEHIETPENIVIDNHAEVLCAEELNISSDSSSPQERFKKHFDSLVGWGSGKDISNWTNPTEAFEKSNYLAFPKSKRQYLCLDLDWEGSATVWMDEGLPEPTITFVTRANGHSTLAYELEIPVYWPCERNNYKARYTPVNYFKAIQKGYTVFVDGDTGYTNATIKNPFSMNWRVTWSDKMYSLAYLAEFVHLVNTNRENNKFRTKEYAGRNDELFYTLSIWAYRNVKKYTRNDLFYDDLINIATSINSETIPINWPDSGPLGMAEVSGVARGVCKYAWMHRFNPNLKHLFKNYGILGFSPIPENIIGDDREQITRSRQSQGAYYTHGIVKNNTMKKIFDAINALKLKKEKINFCSISNECNVGYNNVRKYKDYIREILSK
ncbi:MAG: replication initiation protein [Solidesulfovibrio sp.]|uniref:replication initiation protein n=1 Tax=Solidesulfovibrio sp. TaxID=2910990 RepID=UPI00315960BE